MPEKHRNYEDDLSLIMNALAESIADSTEETIVAEVRETGEDPEVAAERVRGVLRNAVKNYRQQLLVEAQKQYDIRVATMRDKEYALPKSISQMRQLLSSVLSQRPELQALLTAQCRDFKDFPDSDVESILKQLQELGVWDDFFGPK